MIQHVLLLVVAPPLIVLARPWIRLWRGAAARACAAGSRAGSAQGERTRWLRSASRTLGSPAARFVAFSVVLLAWHVPALFDATLRSEPLHALEHTLFFATAVMFWKQVIDSPPLHAPAHLGAARRLPRRRDGRQLGARDRARARARPALLRTTPHEARRDRAGSRRSPTSSSRRA